MLSRQNKRGAQHQAALDTVFRALGDKTRREILFRLSHETEMVTEIARHFKMSLPAVGKHIRVLEKAGLIERKIDGRTHRCSIRAEPLQDAMGWFGYYQQFWSESLDSLSAYRQREEHKLADQE